MTVNPVVPVYSYKALLDAGIGFRTGTIFPFVATRLRP